MKIIAVHKKGEPVRIAMEMTEGEAVRFIDSCHLAADDLDGGDRTRHLFYTLGNEVARQTTLVQPLKLREFEQEAHNVV